MSASASTKTTVSHASVARVAEPLAKKTFALLLAMTLLAQSAFAVEVGETLPKLSLPLLIDGAQSDRVELSASFAGKLVYVDVWASWCGPCRQSMPILNDIRNEFADRGFEVVAVNVDEKLSDALKFLRKRPVDYPILLDPKGSLPRTYELVAMPTSYLVGPDGVVLYKHVGFKKSDVENIRNTIEAFLPE